MGLRPSFEVLKQRVDEYLPLKSSACEKPHRRRKAGFPEGIINPGYKRYKQRIQADVDGMRFWGNVPMVENHGCLKSCRLNTLQTCGVPYWYS